MSKNETKKMKTKHFETKVGGNKSTPTPGEKKKKKAKAKKTVTHGPAISLERRKPRNANREDKVMYNQL